MKKKTDGANSINYNDLVAAYLAASEGGTPEPNIQFKPKYMVIPVTFYKWHGVVSGWTGDSPAEDLPDPCPDGWW